jgi:hydroxymethylpyrimidine/phosphomethylpyrimidine kinase
MGYPDAIGWCVGMSGRPSSEPARVLTIAGSDSGGGAGIQADLKTMHQLGVYGMSVVTAVTAQNTLGVMGIETMSAAIVEQQVSAVFGDLGVDAVKTGMLASAATVEVVASLLSRGPSLPLVVDPVMVAKGGAPLLSLEAVNGLRTRLFPLARVVTPNLPEASAITGYPVRTISEAERAARDITALGPPYVVVKGGHREESGGMAPHEAMDVVYAAANDTIFYLAASFTPSRNTHGTGCTFSSAIAALLALGWDTEEAIAGAKAFVSEAIRGSKGWNLGHGHGPTDHFAPTPPRFRPLPGVVNRYDRGHWCVDDEGSPC